MINKDKLTGFAAGIAAAALLCTGTAFAQNIEKTLTAVYDNIKIIVNGTEITPKDVNGNAAEPFIVDGTTYLPVRALADALGQDVYWDADTKSVYIGKMPEPTQSTESEEVYSVNKELLSSFSDLPLSNIGTKSIKGSFYNLYVTQNTQGEYFSARCDNFSPDKTLQSLTIGSKKAAEVLTDEISDMYRSMLSVYIAAEKDGFLNESSTREALSSQWNLFCSQFNSENELNAFFKENNISSADFKDYLDVFTVYNLYINNIYEKNNAKEYSQTELSAYANSEFVKVKHILVTDESLAEKIISELKKGASFDKLLKEYNEDPGQGDDGYTFTKGEMVKPFEDAAFALKKNCYTLSPVKTDYGYHIIYRYPIKSDWIRENASSLKESAVNKACSEQMESLLKSTPVSYTEHYRKYISTIE